MLRVCVIFGGVNSEHEVSLQSATCILENLDRTRYDVVMLGITKGGRWLHYTGPVDWVADGRWEHSAHLQPATFSLNRGRPGLLLSNDTLPASEALRRRIAGGEDIKFPEDNILLPIDVVFPVLHGKNGEDGTIQGMLDLSGIPYVGSGCLSSAACMDKEVTHALLTAAGVPKTKLIPVRRYELEPFDALTTRLEEELGYPMFVKPANAGSSVGVSKVTGREGLRPALDLALEHDHKAVVEQAVEGQEIECAVLGNENPVASKNLGEIEPTHDFYDYAGKYLDDSTALHLPARVAPDVVERVREEAVKAFRVMECRGLARVDFFVKADGSVILNELNTMPGFTSISMYPRLFMADGMTCAELVDRLIDCALDRDGAAGL